MKPSNILTTCLAIILFSMLLTGCSNNVSEPETTIETGIGEYSNVDNTSGSTAEVIGGILVEEDHYVEIGEMI